MRVLDSRPAQLRLKLCSREPRLSANWILANVDQKVDPVLT
ncbi:MAG: hypothetical protein ABSF32_12655 [Ignavibacteria bacterium]